MIVDVPFFYDFPYIPHRNRNQKTATVLDAVPIEIVEATSDQAPVALRVSANRFSRSWNAGQPRDYRFWSGSFWRPFSAESGSGKKNRAFEAMTAGAFLQDAAREGGYFTSGGQSWKFERAVALDTLMPCRPKASPEALRDDVIRQIQAKASNVLLVDGMAFHRISEPVYRLKQWGDVPEQSSIEIAHVNQIEAKDDPAEFFRADRFDDAAAEFERRTGRSIAAADLMREERGFIEVLLAEVLRFRYDMRPRVLSEATEILSWMKGGVVKHDLAFATAFIRLRDALMEVDVDHDAVARLLGGPVAETLRKNGEWDGMIERAEQILKDWCNREDPDLIRDHDIAAALAM
jgi:hypothetical protein